MLRVYLELPRVVHLLVLGAFVNRVGSFVVPFLTLYLGAHLGLGDGVATAALGAYGVGSLLGTLVGGHLADRIGRRAVMIGALLGAAVMLLALSRVRSAPTALGAVFLLALVSDAYRPAVQAFIADVVPAEQRVHAFGLNYVVINLAFVVASVLGGILSERSFAALFYVDAATGAVFALLIATLLPESLPAPTPSQRARPPEGVSVVVGRIARDRVFLLFCLALIFVSLTFAQAFATLPLYMRDLGIGPKTYGRVIAVNGFCIVVFQLLVTALVSRMARAYALAGSAIFVGVGFGLNAVMTTPLGLALAVVVWTTGEMMQSPVVGPVVADLAPRELRARYMAVAGFAMSAGIALGSPLGGVLRQAVGSLRFWLLAAVFPFASAALVLALGRRLRPAARVG